MLKTTSTKASLKETLSTVIWALAIAFVLRTFLFQPFHIPSGSMLPGLMKGDYIITSKYSVGYGRFAAAPLPFPVKKGRLLERGPNRGDVIVFRPDGSNKNYIKRLIGLPGDQIQMQNGQLFINGTPADQALIGEESFDIRGVAVSGQRLTETLPTGETHDIFNSQDNNQLDNTGVFTVPAGRYFLMGDNRDHSLDSRVAVRSGGAGTVPKENIIGRAEIVLLSVNDDFDLKKPWTWANMRGNRFFKGID
ncbi:signal peptidase I [Litorimonas sp. RW-G-Af-16]|uniref:signal peptidase I n=1 Tax=Litorimonas sp. RW-G-Af-16 TaxID=3241168 RepID=UPI00390CD5CC